MVPVRFALIAALGIVFGAGSKALARQEPAGEAKAPAPTPIEERPYKIRAFISFDPMTRIDARGRDRLVDAWLGLARRMVGPAWEIQVSESEGATSGLVLDTLDPAAVKPLGQGFDKVWLIQGWAEGGAIALEGREYDVTTGWLGSLQVRRAPFASDVSRALFQLSDAMFAPFAEIGEASGDVVPLRVQGAALPKGQLGLGIAPPDTVFRPIRIFYKDDDSILNIQRVPFSYLRVAARDGGATQALLIRGVADPLSKRFSRKNKLIALGVKPGASPTRFRFVQAKDQPASGYVLTARPAPDGPARVVATTDREGRVEIPRGFADGLLIVRLIAGRAEPLREVPIMPGELEEELTIPVDPKHQAITLETQLDALRDTIVDLVAVRGRLERRMKAREQGDDWAGVEEVLVEFRKLPPRDLFVKRLERLVEDAEAQEQRIKSVVLTKAARAQIADTRSLIDRYLDDEIYRAYEDAVIRARERDARAKAAAKARPKARPGRPPQPAAAPEAAIRPDACRPCRRRRARHRRASTRSEPPHQSTASEPRRESTSSRSGRSSASRVELGLSQPKSFTSFGPLRKSRSRAGVESRSMWAYQVVTIRTNSSIFSSCSRV